MQEIADSDSLKMSLLNSAIIQSIEATDCTIIEVITVLRVIQAELDRTFLKSISETKFIGTITEDTKRG